MVEPNQFPSDSYLDFERRLRQFHTLIRAGDGESVEADLLRDEMDIFWFRLSREERDAIDTLSAKLNHPSPVP